MARVRRGRTRKRRFWAAAVLCAAAGGALPADAAPGPGGDGGATPAFVTGIDPDQITCFLGGAEGSEFLSAEDLADRFRGPTPYRLYSLTGAEGEAVAPGPPVNEGSEGECADLWRHEIALDPRKAGAFLAALHAPGAGDPLPKILEVLDAPRPEHEALLRDFLARRDVADPVIDIRQTIRTDLDGDGAEDWIINAVHEHPTEARKGDYSVVLVLKSAGTSTRTFIVQDEVTLEDSPYASTLWVNDVVAVLDIDGDGQMEIIMSGTYLYGGGWELIRFEQGGFEHILFCGCDG